MKLQYFIKRIIFLFIFIIFLSYCGIVFYSCYFGYIQSQLLQSKWYLKEFKNDSFSFEYEMNNKLPIQLNELQIHLSQNNQLLSSLSLENWSFSSPNEISFSINSSKKSTTNELKNWNDLSTLQTLKLHFDSYSIGLFHFSLKEDVYFLSLERFSDYQKMK